MITGNSWISSKVRVGSTKRNGKGVFAKQNIKKNERLAILGGSIMFIDDIDNLSEKMQYYPMQIEERFVICGNKRKIENTDFFNHSCSPNCGFKGQIFLVAMRNIKKGEEITFDYAMTISESVGSNTVFEMKCNCGFPNCRGKVTEKDWKDRKMQKRYKGYFSEYIQEKIDRKRKNR